MKRIRHVISSLKNKNKKSTHNNNKMEYIECWNLKFDHLIMSYVLLQLITFQNMNMIGQ